MQRALKKAIMQPQLLYMKICEFCCTEAIKQNNIKQNETEKPFDTGTKVGLSF